MKQITTIIGGLIASTPVLGIIVWQVQTRLRRRKGKTTNKLVSSLRDEKLKSSIVLNAIDDGVILIDDQKTLQLFNPAAATITGWPASEAMGLDYHAVLKLVDEHDKPYTEAQDPLARVFESKAPVRDNNATLVSRSNKRVLINLSVSPLLDANNAVNGAVGIFRDVSEERSEEKRRADFISTASHEMRTPVAAIEGYLALALNDRVSTVDSRARQYLEKAHLSTEHLGKLFQDLLTSAKAEDGRLSSHPVVVEMGKFLEQVAEDLRFGAEKKGLALEFVVSNSGGNQVIDASRGGSFNRVVNPLYYVHVDPERLREVITNLFDNAIKFTERGKISIGITGDHDVVQFHITDTGPGIPAEDVGHLFQKFYRVDNSATRTIGGTGLGLFISRKIIELYSGRIWVESEEGKGSTFYINLPRMDSQRAAQLQTVEAAGAPLAPVSTTAGT